VSGPCELGLGKRIPRSGWLRSEVHFLSPRPKATFHCTRAYHVSFTSSCGWSLPTRLRGRLSRTVPERVARSWYLTHPPQADSERHSPTDLPGASRSADALEPGGSYSAPQPRPPGKGQPGSSAEAIGREVSALIIAVGQARHHGRRKAMSCQSDSLPFPSPDGILSMLAARRGTMNP
jgi:hypothetical protein